MRAVLITIADAANRDGEHARPGMQAMVEGALYSEGHVQRTVGRLIEDCWMVQTEVAGPGKVAEYALRDPATGVGIFESIVAHGARRSSANVAPTSRKRRANTAHPDARRSDAQALLPITETVDGVAAAPPDANGNGRALATDDPVKRCAHTLTVFAFEQPVKPVTRGGFAAVMARIEAELRAGRSDQAIRAAITAGDVTWTADGLRTAINMAAPRASRRAGGDGDDRTLPEIMAAAAEAERNRR